MIVYLVRHGETAAGGGTDPPLSDRGREAALSAGRLISAGGGLSRIFVSPLKRTSEHGALIASSAGGAVIVDSSLEPEGDGSAFLQSVMGCAGNERVAAVTHLPVLKLILSHLIGQGCSIGVHFGRGGIACVELGGMPAEPAGVLLYSLSPELLARCSAADWEK